MTIENRNSESVTHSVEFHLSLSVDDYDRIIRTLVPYYDEMQTTATTILNDIIKGPAKVLELGGGTGSLTQAIMKNCPHIAMEMIDIDNDMLKKARYRLSKEIASGRVDIRHGSYYDPLPKSKGIVAALALHHIPELEQKTRVYQAIYQALEPGGIFINLDATVHSQKEIKDFGFKNWASWMNEHGIDRESAYKHFSDWAKEDRYFSLTEELGALSRAGFTSTEIFWRKGPMSIYGGIKDRDVN